MSLAVQTTNRTGRVLFPSNFLTLQSIHFQVQLKVGAHPFHVRGVTRTKVLLDGPLYLITAFTLKVYECTDGKWRHTKCVRLSPSLSLCVFVCDTWVTHESSATSKCVFKIRALNQQRQLAGVAVTMNAPDPSMVSPLHALPGAKKDKVAAPKFQRQLRWERERERVRERTRVSERGKEGTRAHLVMEKGLWIVAKNKH